MFMVLIVLYQKYLTLSETIKSCTIRQQGNMPLMLAKNASCFKMVNSELNLNHEELFFQLLFPELQ